MAKQEEFVARASKVLRLNGEDRFYTILEWNWGVLVTRLPFELQNGQPVVITVAEFKEPGQCAE